MAEKVGGVYIEIQAKMGNLERDLRVLQERLNQTDKTGTNLKKTFQQLTAGIGVTAAIYKLVNAYGDAIAAGSKLQETQNKFDVVFRESKKQAETFAKTLVDSYGLATEEAMSFLAGTGDILIGMGMASDKALDLSNGVAQLGIDLASFTNVEGGATRAINALTSALTGEREALKAYGIVVNEELIKAELVATGKDKLTGMARKQAESEATLAIAFRQSGNAIGDMARSFDSYANIQRRVDSQTADFQASIGSQLIPAMSNLGLAFLSASKDGGFLGEAIRTITKYIADTIDGIALLIAKFDQFNSTSKLESTIEDTSTLISYNKNLIKQYGDLASLKKAAETSDAAKEELALYEANNKAIERNIKLTQTQKEESDKKISALANIQDRIANSDKVIEANQAAIANREKEREKEKLKAPEKLTKKAEDEAKKRRELLYTYGSQELADVIANVEAKMAAYNTLTSGITSLSSNLSALVAMDANNQSTAIDNRTRSQLDAIEETYNAEKAAIENSLLTEEEKNAALANLDTERARQEKAIQEQSEKEKRKIARQSAEIQKKIAIFETLVAIPTAAFQAYKSAQVLPFPASQIVGAAMAAAAAGLGAAKLKLISDQPLPALAAGGIVPAVPGGNQFTIGEAGSAEAVIPLNDQTLGRLASMINGAGGGGGQVINLNLSIDGDKLYSNIYRASKNGQFMIDSQAVV